MSEPTSGESLVAILDELTDLVASARSMPMSASAIVNRAEVLDLIDSAKDVLPGQISQADRLIADADAVLDRARREAAAILEKARARADHLVSEEAVVAAAEAKAAEIVAAAHAEGDRLAREADDYCDRQLAQFEIDLGAINNQVAAGRARLLERARGRAEKTAGTVTGTGTDAGATSPQRVSRIDRFRGDGSDGEGEA